MKVLAKDKDTDKIIIEMNMYEFNKITGRSTYDGIATNKNYPIQSMWEYVSEISTNKKRILNQANSLRSLATVLENIPTIYLEPEDSAVK